jgi:hypothetical protein
MQAPASVRRANRARETGSGRDLHDTVLPQAPTGPRAAVRTRKTTGAGRHRPRRGTEVPAMTTITKLTKKIERMSALNGWRMRWYMQ